MSRVVVPLFTVLLSMALAQSAFAQAPEPAITPTRRPVATPAEAASTLVPVASTPTLWSLDDVHFMRRTRRVARVGKVLSVVGRLTLFGLVMAGSDFASPEYWAVLAAANSGEIMWSIADLRAVNRLNDRGIRTRRGAAITSLVGAFTFAPVSWIAGPIASAAVRRQTPPLPSSRGPNVQVLGGTMRWQF